MATSQGFFNHRKCITRSLILQPKTFPIVVGSRRQRARLLFTSPSEREHRSLCRMEFGIGVSVLSSVEPRSPSECLHRFTSRFFLNLRSIAYHQRTSVLDQPFEPCHARPRSIRKQSGRLTTANFVDLEIRKTVYSSGASPNEGEIEQADIFHLEVIDSETHQQRR